MTHCDSYNAVHLLLACHHPLQRPCPLWLGAGHPKTSQAWSSLKRRQPLHTPYLPLPPILHTHTHTPGKGNRQEPGQEATGLGMDAQGQLSTLHPKAVSAGSHVRGWGRVSARRGESEVQGMEQLEPSGVIHISQSNWRSELLTSAAQWGLRRGRDGDHGSVLCAPALWKPVHRPQPHPPRTSHGN